MNLGRNSSAHSQHAVVSAISLRNKEHLFLFFFIFYYKGPRLAMISPTHKLEFLFLPQLSFKISLSSGLSGAKRCRCLPVSPAYNLSQGHTQSRATSRASAPKFMQELLSWTKPRSPTTDGHESVGTYPCISSLFSNVSSSFFCVRISTLYNSPSPSQALCGDWLILQSAWVPGNDEML